MSLFSLLLYELRHLTESLYIVNLSSTISLLRYFFNSLDQMRSIAVINSLLRDFGWQFVLRSFSVATLLCTCLAPGSAVAGEIVDLEIGKSAYQIELAVSPAQRRQGLMHRQQLDSRQGMLLVYQHVGDHRIWMKNMRIALRVFWIDEDFTVVSVQRLQPCSNSPCPVFSAPRPTRYVLELGDYEHALGPGDRIEGLAGLIVQRITQSTAGITTMLAKFAINTIEATFCGSWLKRSATRKLSTAGGRALNRSRMGICSGGKAIT